MRLHYITLLISVLLLTSSCKSETPVLESLEATESTLRYEYQVGLGYGFLGKAVQVTIDGQEVISIVGTEEIEQYAQLQGTKILVSRTSIEKDITVRVTVDDSPPYEQPIDLSTGMYIHIYQEQTGLHIFNTRFLVLE